MRTHIASTMSDAHEAARAMDALREEAASLTDAALIEHYCEAGAAIDLIGRIWASVLDAEIRRRHAARCAA